MSHGGVLDVKAAQVTVGVMARCIESGKSLIDNLLEVLKTRHSR